MKGVTARQDATSSGTQCTGHGVGGMIGFALVGGVAFGIYCAVDTALMSEVLPSSGSRAHDLGILNIANTGGQVLAPVASSLLVGLGAGFLPAFLGAMLACALGAALIAPITSVR
ncbi:hypothetical protein ACIA5G_33710 [Amycolatopsis sp. NPDC051758]|uniref:hypothetical protein n=1 Tax=Amycolatopsis sp. NPDC051758 TaxID=3363935 RepID=UPI0037B467AE